MRKMSDSPKIIQNVNNDLIIHQQEIIIKKKNGLDDHKRLVDSLMK